MSTLNKKFDKNLVITKKKLEETKELVNKEVAGTLSKTKIGRASCRERV